MKTFVIAFIKNELRAAPFGSADGVKLSHNPHMHIVAMTADNALQRARQQIHSAPEHVAWFKGDKNKKRLPVSFAVDAAKSV
jgi:hypothetical protein